MCGKKSGKIFSRRISAAAVSVANMKLIIAVRQMAKE